MSSLETNIKDININELEISSQNARKFTDDESLEELANNISLYGLINPLTVRLNEGGRYEIIAGQRRYIAMQKLKYSTVRCNIISDNISSDEQVLLSVIENTHRQNMKLSQRVKAFNRVLANNNNNKEETAKKLSVSKQKINQYQKISHFSDNILDKLDAKGKEQISLDFAIQLSMIGITDEVELERIIDEFQDVKQKNRIRLIKQIANNVKYNQIEDFHKYINKIHKIKTNFLKDLEKEEKIKKEMSEQTKIKIEELMQTKNIIPNKDAEKEEMSEQIKELMQTKNIIPNKDLEKEEMSEQIKELMQTKNIIPNKDLEKEEMSEQIKELMQTKNTNYEDKIKQLSQSSDICVMAKIRNPQLQDLYRKAVVERFKSCIVSGLDAEVCEAAHIIPFSQSNDFNPNNGLLLNCILHRLFDKYYWSINPLTLCVVVSDKSNMYEYLKQYMGKHIKILSQYNHIIKYLEHHYNAYLKENL